LFGGSFTAFNHVVIGLAVSNCQNNFGAAKKTNECFSEKFTEDRNTRWDPNDPASCLPNLRCLLRPTIKSSGKNCMLSKRKPAIHCVETNAFGGNERKTEILN
jgi:hypothetical protein